MSGSTVALAAAGFVAALLVYWGLFRDNRQRVAFAGLVSFCVILFVNWWGALVLLGQSVLVFYLGRRLREGGGRAWALLGALTVPLTVLLFFKYVGPRASAMGWLPHIAIPLGVSYYSFKHLHYLIESGRGKFGGRPLDEYLTYIFFLPMFVAGPIERYDRFSAQAPEIRLTWANVSLGLERMLYGAFKKYVIADFVLKALYLEPRIAFGQAGFPLMQDGSPELAWYQLTFAGFIKYMYIYMDFSGYTDMVLGLSRLFGFKLIENFNFPFLRSNLAEFWRHWHISLSSWARDYVYFPLMGRFRSPVIALTATMMTIGVWHGLRVPWIMWALHHSAGLVLLAYFDRWARRRPRLQAIRATNAAHVVGIVGTIWWVSIGHLITLNMDLLQRGDIIRVYLEALTFGVVS